MVKRFTFDGEGSLTGEEDLFRDWGRIRAITYHEGSLYISTSNQDGLGTPGEEDDLLIRVTPQ
ncbi:PQQ-dependent sugar dehydrogenase [Isachenkonia alkalipeptolytica]|uniref:PQQ-dependent sugar dehydrogenase n=1 Tax=Isachenkonia alkalipeptolytica TaxID=2565777 RepID=A0AA43XJB7_9CLOT|nr:PQQ-dependent sugar dehydrogenase [Isachenkonia alkalipeptolytica]NBG87782.1 PQQ-dependent sugar dehydrogenase [Isachenkonia alkalipeptolytica]